MPILCLDFDGVMTTYASGWKAIDVCPDPPVEGLEFFLKQVLKHFDVYVYSSRSMNVIGRNAMRAWCLEWLSPSVAMALRFPEHKPPACVTLDDRGMTFTGQWPTIETLLAFQPWTKNTAPPNERPTVKR